VRGAIYIAYGKAAEREAKASIETLQYYHPTLHVRVIGERIVPGTRHSYMAQEDAGGRWAKVNLDKLSPCETTLYIDADTRIRGDLSRGFDIIDDGWDMAITASKNQETDWLWHVGDADRAATSRTLGHQAIQLQGGLFFFARNAGVTAFFEQWRREWRKFENQDQGAMLRALHKRPLKVWLLGRDYNGGALVDHRFGMARS